MKHEYQIPQDEARRIANEIANKPLGDLRANIAGAIAECIAGAAGAILERDQWREACLAHGEKAAAAERERDQLRAKLAEYDGLLCECDEYFDNRADADMDQDGYIPNEEMKMLTAIRARSRMGGENE